MSNVIQYPVRHGLTFAEVNQLRATFRDVEIEQTETGHLWAFVEAKGSIIREAGKVIWMEIESTKELLTSPSFSVVFDAVRA